jgi:NAD(P)H-nitrite reductase large subunit
MEPDPDTILCRCEEVTVADVLAAIADGARTVRGVQLRTRASMGLCQGRTCGRLIAELLARATGQDRALVSPRRVRAPVRPLTLTALSRHDGSSAGRPDAD